MPPAIRSPEARVAAARAALESLNGDDADTLARRGVGSHLKEEDPEPAAG
jgi:hypothetical protein